MFFICELCKIVFKNEQCFHAHMERNEQCLNYGIKSADPSLQNIIYECEKCEKEFSDNKIFIHHMKVCGTKSKKVEIHINNYLENTTGNIDESDLEHILSQKYTNYDFDPLICYLIKRTNFNPKNPEHHNIYLGGFGYSHAEIYRNGEWIKKKIQDIQNELLDSKIIQLKNILKNHKLSKTDKQRIEKVIIESDRSNHKSRKYIISLVKFEIYNGRSTVIPIWKLFRL